VHRAAVFGSCSAVALNYRLDKRRIKESTKAVRLSYVQYNSRAGVAESKVLGSEAAASLSAGLTVVDGLYPSVKERRLERGGDFPDAGHGGTESADSTFSICKTDP
jgi:hypothetical protein